MVSLSQVFGNSPSKTSKELLDQRDKKQEERRQHQDIKANKESLISYFMEIMKLLVLKVSNLYSFSKCMLNFICIAFGAIQIPIFVT